MPSERTLHYIDEGADSGDILAQKIIPVTNNDDVNSLRRKLTSEGAKLLVKVVDQIGKSKTKLKGKIQRESEASFAPRRYPSDGKIAWTSNTRDIFNLIRSLKSPYPNAFSINAHDEKVEIEKSYLAKTPGTVLAQIQGYYLITTGDGVIMVKSKTKLKIGEVLR